MSLSWFRSRVPIERSRAHRLLGMARRASRCVGVLSRIWSVGGGRCPPLRACWSAPSTATARWSAWWGHRASARAVWCARLLRWQRPQCGGVHRLLRVAHQPGPLPCRGAAAARSQRRRVVWTAQAARDAGTRPGSRCRPRGLVALRRPAGHRRSRCSLYRQSIPMPGGGG